MSKKTAYINGKIFTADPEQLYAEARRLGGEVSGEHGIGHAKKVFLRESLGERQIALMRGIKNAFDPNGILNPGKVIG